MDEKARFGAEGGTTASCGWFCVPGPIYSRPSPPLEKQVVFRVSGGMPTDGGAGVAIQNTAAAQLPSAALYCAPFSARLGRSRGGFSVRVVHGREVYMYMCTCTLEVKDRGGVGSTAVISGNRRSAGCCVECKRLRAGWDGRHAGGSGCVYFA